MDITKREKAKFSLCYGIIIALINYLGFLLPGTGNVPIDTTDDWNVWLSFMDENTLLINSLTAVVFFVPALICVLYIKCDEKKLARRMINLPLAYSIFGSLGWILSFFLEAGTLLVVRIRFSVNVFSIAFTSFMYIFQEGLFIFALAFLVLDSIHRRFFLPKYFPEGKLGKISGTKNPSINFLSVIFYISIGFFPVFFLTSTLVNVISAYGVTVDNAVFILIGFIVVFGIILLVIFTGTISAPLRKLKAAAMEVEKGNYEAHCNVVSNDTFGDLADTFNDMIVSLNQKSQKIVAIQDSVIRGMAVMVESRDNSTGGHINRTSDCVKVFVEKLRRTEAYSGLSESFCRNVIKAAPMHDLGKIAVDDAVLRKPGKFTDEEYAIMKCHSSEGARIVENVLNEVDDEEFKKIAINVAHYHHEKWNGSGYPAGLSGESIPLEARIMAFADVFDALVSKRCYKDSFTFDKAFSIMEESFGSHFDPELGKIFLECRADLQELYSKY
ncbi:MAG: HD domain-containing protein [Treponemataceae bacterium]|nr:HD domain-containing protein [Treponemataceae bacterium]